jgi:thiamine biosynthesis lipoprotein
MGTVVTIEVVGHGNTDVQRAERTHAVTRAMGWFRHVEECCSRFDPRSELRRLSEQVGVPVIVSTTTFEALKFALALAGETDGAFDPTVGGAMVRRGFDRHYQTGERVVGAPTTNATYADVEIDVESSTITLHRPLQLDLGSVAKGMAIDLAVRELEPFTHFAVNAGGDLFVGGRNMAGEEWSVGIKHPRDDRALIDTRRLSNRAMCTSGDYERRSPVDTGEHHILDPRSGASASAVASATVVAPLAMVADGLATAAFVLGPPRALDLLRAHGADGLLVTPELERFSTPGWPLG